MYSLRKWLYKPKKSDSSLLAQFYYADEELNMVATELDSFDGRKDPERCATLVNQLRVCQDKVLTHIQKIMDQAIDVQRANRDFRVKFPDDVLQESLGGQLWFGAECLAAGSSIMNREVESASMRPLARALTKNLDSLRAILRDQCLRNINCYTDRIKEALVIFDKLFAEFELSYVSAMVPVKTMREYDLLQEVIVLFSETVQRSLDLRLLTQDMIDDYDPALMFTIPRLAIVCGLLIYPEGPLNPDNDPLNMPEMFRPFQILLYKIRELLYTLSTEELFTLEKALCSQEEPAETKSLRETSRSDFHQQNGDLHAEGGHSSACLCGEEAVGNEMRVSLDGPIIVHTPNSGSPVTPVKDDEPFSLGQMSQSPSLVTIVVQTHSLSEKETERLEEMMDQALPTCMNHQDSSDSGMHSENTSLSENATESIPDLPHHQPPQEGDDSVFVETVSASSSNQSSFCDRNGAMETDRASGVSSVNGCAAGGSPKRRERRTESNPEDNTSPCACRCSLSEIAEGQGEDSAASLEKIHSDLLSSSRQRALDSEIPEISVCGASSENSELDSASSGTASDSGTLVHHADEISFCPEGESSQHVDNSQHGNGTVGSAETMSKRELEMDPSHFSHKAKTSGMNQYSDQLQSRDPKTDGSRLVSSNIRSQKQAGRSSTSSFDRLKGGKSGSSLQDREEQMSGEYLEVPRLQSLRYASDSISSTCSSCRTGSTVSSECEWDRESCASSETSSYNSECHDDEEIALAIQAADLASRNEARSRFRSSSDLIHRLFVCISGVADQLQTNYASDLRNILKSVFDLNCSEPLILADDLVAAGGQHSRSFVPQTSTSGPSGPSRDQGHNSDRRLRSRSLDEPPLWVPDEDSPCCSSCKIPFTIVRRRHHCRNCGKIYCSRCSPNSVPLPHFGHAKPVRVCNHCFMFQVTPFTMAE
ncbi:lateral signaling target protein 2 homolog isoform X2 [Liolophura sinensis]|uniref:lateral signaling target protein 2 homolog isoform X2 n=1 Tax=Liolophura sinensis TaxID=3198878 RepID=UPI003158B328